MLIVSPEKYVYLSDIKKCRHKPFNEILLENIHKHMTNNCTRLCIPQHYFICRSDAKIEQIPRCKTMIEEKCFFRMKKEIQPQLVKKPCTKLQYSNIVVESTRKYRLST